MTKPDQQLMDQLIRMCALQIEHNVKVHPQWDSQGYEFYRAIWIECAELLEHYGWKWWKKQERNIEQVELEIVDIWHFGLSKMLSENIGMDRIAAEMAEASDPTKKVDFRQSVERLARSALRDEFRVAEFVDVMNSIDMSIAQLVAIYVGKNILNQFRQANGYKEGTYRKSWQGREDNEILAEIVREMDVTEEDFQDRLGVELNARYRASSR